MIWLQGETDQAIGTDGAVYEAKLRVVVDRLGRGTGTASGAAREPAWIVFQTSVCGDPGLRSEAIRAAQRRVAMGLPRGLIGPDTDRLGDAYRSDGCHFNAAGREAIVTELMPLIETAAK